MELDGLRVPAVMIQLLFEGEEMSMTHDSDLDCEVDSCFRVHAEDSAMQCIVRIMRIVRGPAVHVLGAVSRDEPDQSVASVLDAISGLASNGYPPTTVVTFMRVKAEVPVV